MNVVRHVHDTFMLYDPKGEAINNLGSEIEIRLRRIIIPGRKTRKVTNLQYVVEITKSTIHNGEFFSANSVAVFIVPLCTSDSRICMSVFKEGAFGFAHRLGLHPYQVPKQPPGHVLTINGLLWDGRILHVKDICI